MLIVPFFVAFVVIVTVVISLVFLFSVYTRSFNYYIYRYILLHYKRVYFGGQCERKKKLVTFLLAADAVPVLALIHSVVHS